MTLTDTFDLKVLTHSDTAAKFKIDNTPDAEAIKNLELLYENILLPLVKHLPGKINVTVAYRCHKLNALLKSKPTSQHPMGKAADLEYYENGKENNKKLLDTIIALNLPFDQLIDERNLSWVHVSYNHGKNRKQFFKL